MKTKTISRKAILLFFAAIVCINFAFAQDKEMEIKNAVVNGQFIFKAETVSPLTGSARQLTPEYDLKVSKASVISYLPYFGRAYSADFNSEGGLKFTSVKFDYSAKPRKKGGWNVDIRPKDIQDPRELSLTISENGSATLHVTSTNRQAISFSGYITGIK